MAHCVLSRLGNLRLVPAAVLTQSSRTTTTKHYNPKYKKLRKEKYLKVELPDYNEDTNALPREKLRQKMKERGMLPPRPWVERPFYISATGGVFEAYVPPEGDGKASLASTTRVKQAAELLEKKSKSMMAIRKIKSFDEDFDSKAFAKQAQDIYIKAHESLANNDKRALQVYVTEKAYAEFRHNSHLKTIRWKFLQSLEPPRVCHARCTDVVSKENIFGQVTVRFHTQQQLAVYDRFGRLLHGSEILAKDVIEYIVYEKHLSNMYGTWRIHDKIIPDWAPPKDPSKLTRVQEEVKEVVESAPVPIEGWQPCRLSCLWFGKHYTYWRERLLHGSEILVKDVIEYIVYEKHLSNMYGTWRIHNKIIPDWAPPKDPSKLTRVQEEVKEVVESAPVPIEAKETAAIADK